MKHKSNRKTTAFILLYLMLLATVLVGFSSSDRQKVYAADETVNAHGFAAGDGSESDPFIIKTAEQLDNVRNYSDEYLPANYFALGADIDMTDYLSEKAEGWKPIEVFAGVFDGRFHTIENLWINRPDEDYVGLFGSVSSAEIKNIKLELAEIGIIGQSRVGGIAGELLNELGTKHSNIVSSCTVSGKIKAVNMPVQSHPKNGISYYSYTMSDSGGIVGFLFNSTVTNCAFYGDISGLSAIGGIAGHSWNGDIKNCLYRGKIDIISDSTEIPMAGSGGIAGLAYSDSLIKNCFFEGTGNDNRTTAIVGFRTPIFFDGKITDIRGDILYFGIPDVSGCYYNSEVFKGTLTYIEQNIEYEDWDEEENDLIQKNIVFNPINCGPLSTSQMRNRSSYVGWDFLNTWGFDKQGNLVLQDFGEAYFPPSLTWLYVTLGCVLFGAAAVSVGLVLYRRKKTEVKKEIVVVKEKETVYVQIPNQSLPESLTAREQEVAKLILEGQTRLMISKILFISESTVKKHIKNVFGKTGCTTQKEFIVRFK